ncbi:MAG TPA: sialidase family protein [Actinomycetota bacterium]|nr:sialidase family protein [Actinomycetota bacterium]
MPGATWAATSGSVRTAPFAATPATSSSVRPGRLAATLAAALLVGVLPGPRAAAAPSWGEARTVADFAWTDGHAVAAAGGQLHVVYVSDLTAKGFARDGGPYQGVFHVSSADGGRSWSQPVRVSQPERHAFRPALASDGTDLYAAWLTQRSYEAYDPADPRVLFVRAGSASGWGPTVRLSPRRGRVDRPAVAASEGVAYVVWTDAGAGRIRLARSVDGGETWRRAEVGRTKALDPLGEGFAGLPAVAASGQTVGVVWISSSRGEVRAKVSTDGGASFGEAVVLARGGARANGGAPAVAAAPDRLTFAWTTGRGVFARTWRGGAWGPRVQVSEFGPTLRAKGGYDLAAGTSPSGAVGLAWAECRTAGCDTLSADSRVALVWAESADGGSWGARRIVAGPDDPERRINDGPSVAWSAPATRVVVFDARASGYTAYAVLVATGTGS